MEEGLVMEKILILSPPLLHPPTYPQHIKIRNNIDPLMRSPGMYPLLVKEWVFRLLFGDPWPSQVCSLEHFYNGKCSVGSFEGSFSKQKHRRTAAHVYQHKPQEGSSYILLHVLTVSWEDLSFHSHECPKRKITALEGRMDFYLLIYLFVLQGGTSIIFMAELDEGQSKHSNAILNNSAV